MSFAIQSSPAWDGPEREAALELERGEDGQLWVVARGTRTPVRVVRCFPWSEPGRYVSLRDVDDEEVAFVRDLGELGRRSRGALTEALREAGFVLEIRAFLAVEEEIEIRTFEVETCQGKRRFQTPRDEWPRRLPGGALLIRDVAGDLYRIPERSTLDPRSRRLLWALAD